MKRFVILDRDGTLIVDRDYLADPAGVELLPGAAESLRRLRSMGLGLIVISNQSGVGRGFFDLQSVANVHQRLEELLLNENAVLDAIYFCPHAPQENCDCRKPRIGLMVQAAAEHHFEPAEAFVIGDKSADIELGRAVGATTLLVRTGYGEQALAAGASPDFVVNDLVEAAKVVSQNIT